MWQRLKASQNINEPYQFRAIESNYLMYSWRTNTAMMGIQDHPKPRQRNGYSYWLTAGFW